MNRENSGKVEIGNRGTGSMTLQTFEGTWEELISHSDELTGRQVKLIVVDALEQQLDQLPQQTLAEALEGLVGTVDSGGSDLSLKTGDAFGELMREKYDHHT